MHLYPKRVPHQSCGLASEAITGYVSHYVDVCTTSYDILASHRTTIIRRTISEASAHVQIVACWNYYLKCGQQKSTNTFAVKQYTHNDRKNYYVYRILGLLFTSSAGR